MANSNRLNRYEQVRLLVAAVVAVLIALVAVGVASADEPDGSSPARAVKATGAWKRLEPGQSMWYAFEYRTTYKEVIVEKRAAKNDEGEKKSEKKYEIESPRIRIAFDAEPLYGTHFTVWTVGRLNEWKAEQLRDEEQRKVIEPIGAGTPDEHANCDCSWVGEFNESGTYYVRVHHDSLEPSYHSLRIEIK